MNKITIIFLFFSLCAEAQLQDRMLQIAKEEFAKDGFSGVVGISTSKESVVLTNGFEDAGKTSPISQHTLFSLASLTKCFTAFGVLDLIEADQLSDSAQIGTWFPCLDTSLAKITIHQLANQSAAIPDFYAQLKEKRLLTNDSVMSFICKLDSTLYQPGLKWGYSNSHYFLLAKIIEAKRKISFEKVVKTDFFDKMYMLSSGFAYQGAALVSPVQNGQFNKYEASVSGEGGIVASGEDMLGFGTALITNQKLKGNLKLAYELSDVFDRDTALNYGYSWFFAEDEHGKFCAASGQGFGYSAYHRFYYEKDIYYFVLSNKESLNFKAFRNRITELVDFE